MRHEKTKFLVMLFVPSTGLKGEVEDFFNRKSFILVSYDRDWMSLEVCIFIMSDMLIPQRHEVPVKLAWISSIENLARLQELSGFGGIIEAFTIVDYCASP